MIREETLLLGENYEEIAHAEVAKTHMAKECKQEVKSTVSRPAAEKSWKECDQQ
jgi:hypothetical protein